MWIQYSFLFAEQQLDVVLGFPSLRKPNSEGVQSKPGAGLLAKTAAPAGCESMITNIAIGIITGGSPAKVRALRATYLKCFSNVLVMGDEAHAAEDIEGVPPEYFCSRNSMLKTLKSMFWHDNDIRQEASMWLSRGRCTQLRFMYTLAELRTRFYPAASWFVLVDDDTFIWSHLFAECFALNKYKCSFALNKYK